MKTSIDIYFALIFFENNCTDSISFTLTELATNKGKYKNTEIFYTLPELHEQEIQKLGFYDKPITVRISRDNEDSIGLLKRISRADYERNISGI